MQERPSSHLIDWRVALNAPGDGQYPTVEIEGNFFELSNDLDLSANKLLSGLFSVSHAECEYMQPLKNHLAHIVGMDYKPDHIKHCTFIELSMENISLSLVHIPAKEKKLSVGHNYFNMNFPEWKYSSSVSGLLGHCFDEEPPKNKGMYASRKQG